MTVNGETRVIGIIGNPVRHTMSPIIHNYISKTLGKNMIYVPFEVTGNVDAAVKGAFELGILGMNVTVPWKSAVMNSLVSVDDMAKRIGAVNTLVRQENGFKGYNTDILGLERELFEEGISLEGKDTLIIGAGGAARATAFLCCKHDAKTLTIINRTLKKADDIAKDVMEYVKENGKQTEILTYSLDDYNKLCNKDYIAFQCTKIGLKEDDGAAIEDDDFYKKIKIGVDLIYREGTKFQLDVKKAGGKSYTGMKMLIFQGICAYELWNDLILSDEIINGVCEVVNGR